MKVVTIIPARGGSKGIPKKNMIDVNGKPLIYYSMLASLKSKVGKETYLCTDSEEIMSSACMALHHTARLGKSVKRPDE